VLTGAPNALVPQHGPVLERLLLPAAEQVRMSIFFFGANCRRFAMGIPLGR